MNFAKQVFHYAGVYGLLVLVPQYFMEGRIGQDFPPPPNHPEHFYGFIGVATAWQTAFLMIARDPVRFRPIMLAGVLEKVSFGVAAIVLFSQGRLAAPILGFGIVDLVLAALFAIAWKKTPAGVSLP